ncbi:profilin [Coniophora puteana RWD-64-598 SS2]|uniref:Profilin n=1 Tax=Coniophora puteana (strain RWD-64-598) TaxID=741705 RepID=A0A5M3MA83_CONPW|nr:profilin [Coniophora puteana RWD-64-598 SS2]EIW75545.1 profilin [Coniophora puteana RWD-64-598 SS2]
MSWQTYVDSNLVGTGKVARAAILGQQGGVWAVSAGYNIAADEQKTIIDAVSKIEASFKENTIPVSSLTLAGRKFIITRPEARSLYGRKQQDGIVVVKTKQAILVAEYQPPTQAGEATVVVEGLADYLIGVGY